MQLNTLETQSQETPPPGILQLVLGQAKNQQIIHCSCSFKCLRLKRTMILDLYDDRVEGRTEHQSYFFLLKNEIYFQTKPSYKQFCFKNRQTGQCEVFITENSSDLKFFCEKLKALCSQVGIYQKYQLTESIAKGKESQVFKATNRQTSEIYALKRCLNNCSLQKQLEILRQLQHPNIIFFHQFFIQQDHSVFIVMDYEDGGNLLDMMKSPQWNTKMCYNLLKDMLNGLEFLRIKEIVHRDLKPQNIIYSRENGTFKIADFQFATKKGQFQNKIVGTPGYISPQIFTIIKGQNVEASFQMDIYSAGLIFYEALTGTRFFEANSKEEILQKNIKGLSFKRNCKNPNIAKLEANILRKMIRTDPDNRKNSYEILQSKQFNDLTKLHGLDIRSSSTQSPDRKNSDIIFEQDDLRIINTAKMLLKIRSSSN